MSREQLRAIGSNNNRETVGRRIVGCVKSAQTHRLCGRRAGKDIAGEKLKNHGDRSLCGRRAGKDVAGKKLKNHGDRRVRQVRADAPSVWAACRQRRRRGTVRHRRLDAPYPTAPSRLVAVATLLAALFLFYPTDHDHAGRRGSFDLSFARLTRVGLRTPIPNRQPALWRTANSPVSAELAAGRR